MADIKIAYASEADLTVTNLHDLADEDEWMSAKITNTTTLGFSYQIHVRLAGTVTAGDVNGYSEVYLSSSLDGTLFDGDTSGSEGDYVATLHAADPDEGTKVMIPLGNVMMPSDDTTAYEFEKTFTVPAWKVPPDFVIVIRNKSGDVLAAATNLVSSRAITATSA